ncbi:MAG TPA: 3-deoxy-manno-octulosonate cytidylyltransferase [Gammaproteobacteria bacterium]
MSDEFFVVIPARYESSRLPGKPLADIGGRPMILRVYDKAVQSAAREVLVATDDERIADVCREAGAQVELTSSEHESGTDRIAEVANRRGWDDDDIVVNVQGDEPLLPPALVDQVAALLRDDPDAALATLMTPVRSEEDWRDPNGARVVVDRNGHALYFSRAPIPWPRDGHLPDARRHIGLYAYRVAALRELAKTPPCDLERIEKLEQLRALWLGMKIAVAVAVEDPPPGVDTQQDLDAVRARLKGG